jgi:hypothetical protein
MAEAIIFGICDHERVHLHVVELLSVAGNTPNMAAPLPRP